jgi:hypothetical protein
MGLPFIHCSTNSHRVKHLATLVEKGLTQNLHLYRAHELYGILAGVCLCTL